MSKEITDTVAKCRFCVEKQPSQRSEPLLPSTLPDRPFERVGVDICEFKQQHFIVMVDYYSRYIDVTKLPNLKSSSVIGKLKGFFAHHGIPNTVISDNGPQFAASELKKHSQENGVSITSQVHRISHRAMAQQKGR